MTLSDIKTYLTTRQRATLTDLAHHFRADAETLRPMLAHWERKGKVRHTQMNSCSKSCCCPEKGLDIYEWLADA